MSLPDLLKISPQRPHFIINNLAKKNEITLYCISSGTSQKGDLLSEELLNGVEIHYFNCKGKSQLMQELLFPIELSDIDLRKFDLCLSFNSLISLIYLSNQKRNKSLRLVLDLCDDLPEILTESTKMPKIIKPFSKPILRKVLNYVLERADGVTYIPTGLADKYRIPQERSAPIPNGIDIERFRNHHIDDEPHLSGNGMISIGFVGYLGPWVDFEPLFVSLKRLNEVNEKEYHLFIAGSGEMLTKHKSLVEQMNIQRHVTFLGLISYDTVPDFISRMDVCVIPFNDSLTSNNSLPIKLFEYMALKKIVISSPLEGIINAVGTTVRYASTSDDYQMILSEIAQSDLAKDEKIEKGFELVEKEYSWKKISVEFEKFLESRVEG